MAYRSPFASKIARNNNYYESNDPPLKRQRTGHDVSAVLTSGFAVSSTHSTCHKLPGLARASALRQNRLQPTTLLADQGPPESQSSHGRKSSAGWPFTFILQTSGPGAHLHKVGTQNQPAFAQAQDRETYQPHPFIFCPNDTIVNAHEVFGLPSERIPTAHQTVDAHDEYITELKAELLDHSYDRQTEPYRDLQFFPPNHLVSNGSCIANLEERSAQIAQALEDDSSIDLQIVPAHSAIRTLKRHKSRSVQQPTMLSFSIVLYGLRSISDDVGRFCQDCDVYLQDPRGCDRDVPYRNPHCLRTEENGHLTTFKIQTPNADAVVTQLQHTDGLDALIVPTQMGEISTPATLKTSLFPHQRQALWFMVKRELSWASGDAMRDMWTTSGSNQELTYRNTITNYTQVSKPTQCKGGILADSMGLGKSCSIIALILHGDEEAKRVCHTSSISSAASSVRATLLIVPPSLLQTWDDQLNRHVRDLQLLGVRKHHGSSRISTTDEAQLHGLVITTYQTVESEWRSCLGSARSLLFSVNWRRIILDEAHYISNHRSSTFKAICDLEAECRWAVTGTPLQNRIGDIAALCQFLRLDPYEDRDIFNKDITNPWKCGDHELAVSRLKRLLGFVLLRRNQGTVKLPKRTDLRITLQLSQEERALYTSVETRVTQSVDAALNGAKSNGTTVAGILQQINELRHLCNLGTYRKPRPTKDTALLTRRWDAQGAQLSMDALGANEDISCTICGLPPDTSYCNFDLLSPAVSSTTSRCWLSSCLKVFCESCMSRMPLARCDCKHACQVVMVTQIPKQSGSRSSSASPGSLDVVEGHLPSKIQALVDNLLDQAPGTKSIVFTFWSSAIDLVAKGLSQASISHARYDGSLSQACRSNVLENFRQDASISVILMTISCAAVGLDITAASRAYILEPQWNPTVEEQALARVHRMGQEKEVTTIRFVMADTFEERVVETQQKKRELAELLLSPGQHAESEHGLDRLRYYRSLLK